MKDFQTSILPFSVQDNSQICAPTKHTGLRNSVKACTQNFSERLNTSISQGKNICTNKTSRNISWFPNTLKWHPDYSLFNHNLSKLEHYYWLFPNTLKLHPPRIPRSFNRPRGKTKQTICGWFLIGRRLGVDPWLGTAGASFLPDSSDALHYWGNVDNVIVIVIVGHSTQTKIIKHKN